MFYFSNINSSAHGCGAIKLRDVRTLLEECIVGQGRFAAQTGHARLGTPLRLAVKLFGAKSAM